MLDFEHAFIALRQKRPLSELHIFVPQAHDVSELTESPSVFEQAEMVEDEHRLYVLWQKRPVVDVHSVLPQLHPALFAVVPSVSVQSGPVVQMQLRKEEHLVVEVVRGLNLRVLPLLYL